MLCENCKKKTATRNYQRVWIMWNVTPDGDYSKDFEKKFDIESPIERNNWHLCDECGFKFEKGKL